MAGKRLAELFFTCDSNDTNVWTCRCGTKRKKAGFSYQNLISHMQSASPDYFDTLSAGESLTKTHREQYFATSKSNKCYGWLDFFVNGLLLFSFAEISILHKHIRHKTMCTDTLMKYIVQLTKLVEMKISKVSPKTIALVFDGWSQFSTQYFAVYASFLSKNDNGYDTRLLAIFP